MENIKVTQYLLKSDLPYSKERYQKNKEKKCTYQRERYRENPEKKRKYEREHYKENPEEKRRYERECYKQQRLEIMALFGTTCLLCGKECGGKIHCHEIHGRRHSDHPKYILEHIEDFVPLCSTCHNMQA